MVENQKAVEFCQRQIEGEKIVREIFAKIDEQIESFQKNIEENEPKYDDMNKKVYELGQKVGKIFEGISKKIKDLEGKL